MTFEGRNELDFGVYPSKLVNTAWPSLHEECRQPQPASTTQPLKKDGLSICVSTDKPFNLILKTTIRCLKEQGEITNKSSHLISPQAAN